jgi:hypothetical protein
MKSFIYKLGNSIRLEVINMHWKDAVEILEKKGVKRSEVEEYASEHGISFSKAVKAMAEEIMRREA